MHVELSVVTRTAVKVLRICVAGIRMVFTLYSAVADRGIPTSQPCCHCVTCSFLIQVCCMYFGTSPSDHLIIFYLFACTVFCAQSALSSVPSMSDHDDDREPGELEIKPTTKHLN